MKATAATLNAIKAFNDSNGTGVFLETYKTEDYKGRPITLLQLGEDDSDLGLHYLVNKDGTLSFYAGGLLFSDLPAHIKTPKELKAVVLYALSVWCEEY